MSRAQLEVIYDGDAVQDGVMDVEDLAPALLGIADACQRANRLMNGDNAKLAVQVQADMRRGSFHVELNLVAHFLPAITGTLFGLSPDHFKAAKDIAELLFGGDVSVLGIIKRLHGIDPKSLKHKIERGDVAFTIPGDNNNVTINIIKWEAVNDPEMRRSLKKAARPLSRPGVHKLEIGTAGKRETVTKDDVPSFADLANAAEGDVIEEERDETLEIRYLNFQEDGKSKFFDGNAEFAAVIQDSAFWKDVHSRKYRVGEGDQLRVRLLAKKHTKPRLRAEYYIIEVLDIIEPSNNQAEFEW